MSADPALYALEYDSTSGTRAYKTVTIAACHVEDLDEAHHNGVRLHTYVLRDVSLAGSMKPFLTLKEWYQPDASQPFACLIEGHAASETEALASGKTLNARTDGAVRFVRTEPEVCA